MMQFNKNKNYLLKMFGSILNGDEVIQKQLFLFVQWLFFLFFLSVSHNDKVGNRSVKHWAQLTGSLTNTDPDSKL